MTQEQFRMQMLAGIITESQYNSLIDNIQSLDDLKIGDHYRIESTNSEGDDITTDYEYTSPIGGYDVKFKIIKSYMNDNTKEQYKKLNLTHFFTPGSETKFTKKYLQNKLDKKQLYKI
jgi:hypothetical protein